MKFLELADRRACPRREYSKPLRPAIELMKLPWLKSRTERMWDLYSPLGMGLLTGNTGTVPNPRVREWPSSERFTRYDGAETARGD